MSKFCTSLGVPPDNADSDDDYLSDASSEFETDILLAYASSNLTDDDFSSLGGEPTWLREYNKDSSAQPNLDYLLCKVCSKKLVLLAQVSGNLPSIFPGHERRLYVFICRNPKCVKQDGSLRVLRALRVDSPTPDHSTLKSCSSVKPSCPMVGNALFGVSQAWGSGTCTSFESQDSTCMDEGQKSDDITLSGAGSDKSCGMVAGLTKLLETSVGISTLSKNLKEEDQNCSLSGNVFPKFYLDVEHEVLGPSRTESKNRNQYNTAVTSELQANGDEQGNDGEYAYESSMNTVFHAFSSRLNQNPEQVLRYEFNGVPLIYDKNDLVGRLFARYNSNSFISRNSGKASTSEKPVLPLVPPAVPPCVNCGEPRVFEFQIVPHAISVLEGESSDEGSMEWGNIIVAVCSKDCGPINMKNGSVGYIEEWIGVQWEESHKA